ncbi:hypothetical protein KIN20_033375 [Parelaphostrongylus tenuis]|uniref:Uncharacterized protein n=1 Tax=Parelaphostrongylus tenuis TaxID=148309 RepID=A0AAD5WJ61_PARTN|nr:hypothetical protein KIN20_033375 [Parelaphostrongylus tenuis]
MLCSPPRRTPTAGSSGKNRNLTKILRLPSIIVIISLLATLSTVFGCEVLPGGQANLLLRSIASHGITSTLLLRITPLGLSLALIQCKTYVSVFQPRYSQQTEHLYLLIHLHFSCLNDKTTSLNGNYNDNDYDSDND